MTTRRHGHTKKITPECCVPITLRTTSRGGGGGLSKVISEMHLESAYILAPTGVPKPFSLTTGGESPWAPRAIDCPSSSPFSPCSSSRRYPRFECVRN